MVSLATSLRPKTAMEHMMPVLAAELRIVSTSLREVETEWLSLYNFHSVMTFSSMDESCKSADIILLLINYRLIDVVDYNYII